MSKNTTERLTRLKESIRADLQQEAANRPYLSSARVLDAAESIFAELVSPFFPAIHASFVYVVPAASLHVTLGPDVDSYTAIRACSYRNEISLVRASTAEDVKVEVSLWLTRTYPLLRFIQGETEDKREEWLEQEAKSRATGSWDE